ncbi:MAG: DUF4258 domain-containing protein [Chloroflexi bacterium]|nr:DUF4258 domain-containing protein [Chloroflexota bacterium]
MKTLEQIRRQLMDGEFDFSHHAFRRTVERNISEKEIQEAGVGAIVVEEYPDDKYGPTWRVLGFTGPGRPLHIQVSVADSPYVRIVTLYEPSEHRWQDYTRRR